MRCCLAVFAILATACTFGADSPEVCRVDADCEQGGCRDGVCITFATPLDEPVDPSDPPDASAVGDAGDAGP